ncbi:hypothetical protein KSX_51710 [Ktedonospora formicarum]|uniref:DUF1294 domain-containing protein n=1 Tax=Ktedonospora formicarum TaxID=2778364 RepID=A0A8J3MUW2_9CHLR|nr:hypothetical protein KSX_51710 [Ktedonospora formicarum]
MKLIIVYFIVLNIVTFVVYGLDKHAAKNRWQRVPENVLLLLAFAGGTPAAYFARNYFRHKTIKRPFINRLRLILIVQICLLVLYILFAFRGQA